MAKIDEPEMMHYALHGVGRLCYAVIKRRNKHRPVAGYTWGEHVCPKRRTTYIAMSPVAPQYAYRETQHILIPYKDIAYAGGLDNLSQDFGLENEVNTTYEKIMRRQHPPRVRRLEELV